MKKIGLLFTVMVSLLIGCNNSEKKEVTLEDNMDAMVSEVVDEHNSQNSLDWNGVYEGITPCADCEGIKTVLELKMDETYTLSMTYLGKPNIDPFEQQGKFSWDKEGSKISLMTDGEPIWVKVGENQLWMLDGDRNVIEGDLHDMFILKKIN